MKSRHSRRITSRRPARNRVRHLVAAARRAVERSGNRLHELAEAVRAFRT